MHSCIRALEQQAGLHGAALIPKYGLPCVEQCETVQSTSLGCCVGSKQKLGSHCEKGKY